LMLLAPLAAVAQQQGYYGSPVRSPWYIGFGIGAGDGNTTVAGNTSSFHQLLATQGSDGFRLAGNFKVGATLNEKTLVGLDITVLRAFGTASGFDTWVQVGNVDCMFTYFPMTYGLFLRGGGGLAFLQTGIGDRYTGAQITNDYGGFGLLGGVGYAFWLGRRFNLTLNLDLSMQFYPWATDVNRSSMVLGYVGFDFY
jgi:hypothetical protein